MLRLDLNNCDWRFYCKEVEVNCLEIFREKTELILLSKLTSFCSSAPDLILK